MFVKNIHEKFQLLSLKTGPTNSIDEKSHLNGQSCVKIATKDCGGLQRNRKYEKHDRGSTFRGVNFLFREFVTCYVIFTQSRLESNVGKCRKSIAKTVKLKFASEVNATRD